MSRKFELLQSQELSGFNSVTEVVEFIRFTLTRWNHTIVSIDGNNIDMGTYDIRVFKNEDSFERISDSTAREQSSLGGTEGSTARETRVSLGENAAREQSSFEIKIFTTLPARGIWEDYYEQMLYKLYYQSEHRDQLLDAHFDKL